MRLRFGGTIAIPWVAPECFDRTKVLRVNRARIRGQFECHRTPIRWGECLPLTLLSISQVNLRLEKPANRHACNRLRAKDVFTCKRYNPHKAIVPPNLLAV